MRTGCHSGKKSYPSEAVANNALVLICARYKQRGNTRFPKSVYLCPRCDEWHLTRRTKKAPQSVTAGP